MPEVPLYDRFSIDYDRFVNWEGRLAYEWPFLHGQLTQAGARRVLDTACGTGQHAIALAKAGYEVVGADLSAAMIAKARQNALAHAVDVRFIVAGFGQLAERVDGTFDAVLCLGNSLPHVADGQALGDALRDFRATLRPGGLLIIQNLNFDRILGSRQRFMPLQVHREGDQEWLFLRFYDFHEGPSRITFNVVTLHRSSGDEWTDVHDSTELQPVSQADLKVKLPQAGFGQTDFYGGLAGEPFDPQSSGNLVAVARAV